MYNIIKVQNHLKYRYCEWSTQRRGQPWTTCSGNFGNTETPHLRCGSLSCFSISRCLLSFCFFCLTSHLRRLDGKVFLEFPGDVTDFDRVHLYFFQVLCEYRHDNLFLSLSLQIYPMRTYSAYLAIFRYIWPWHAMIAMASFL